MSVIGGPPRDGRLDQAHLAGVSHGSGRAVHAALPHPAKDPTIAAAHLLLAGQSIVARNVNPLEAAVATVGMLESGNVPNRIPETAILRGTFRSYPKDLHLAIGAATRRIAAGIGAAFDIGTDVSMMTMGAATINSEEEAASAARAAAGLAVRRDLSRSMTGQDFAWHLQERPGAFA